MKSDKGKILREICERMGVEIIEAECCKDHVHMLIKISTNIICNRRFKRKSTLKRYYVDPVKNKDII